jgi:hypothetical protein
MDGWMDDRKIDGWMGGGKKMDGKKDGWMDGAGGGV